MPSSTTTKTDYHSSDNDSSQQSTNKAFKRMYYPSNKKGGGIVNAITGQPYQWKSGTIDTLRLFRVVDSSGKCDKNGFYDRRGNHRETFNKEPNILYYDGPSEYMNHRKTRVDPGLVSAWNETRGQLFTNGGELNLEVYHNLKASDKIKATLKQ